MQFTKYQGLGNDFVIVEAVDESAVTEEHAKSICDRHFGVGADGVLLVLPSEHALATMRVINADGSRPEMCGNGLRCVALHLSQRGDRPKRFSVETDAGLRHCEITERDAKPWIRISLGRGELFDTASHDWKGKRYSFQRASMGNPHLVSFQGLLPTAEIDDFAPTVSASQPNGANIEFVEQVGPLHLRVIVWERGVGRTLACGTGAGAVALAAAAAGLVPFEQPVTVELPGGALEISVSATDHEVELTGPAQHVFDGQLG